MYHLYYPMEKWIGINSFYKMKQKFYAVETSVLSCRNKSLDIKKTNESSRITGDGHREESQPNKCKTVVFST